MPGSNKKELRLVAGLTFLWLLSFAALWASLYLPPIGIFSINVNELGDSFGILNSFVSIITLLYLYKTYQSGEDVGKENTKHLAEQSFQNLLSLLLTASKDHIDDISIPAGAYGESFYRTLEQVRQEGGHCSTATSGGTSIIRAYSKSPYNQNPDDDYEELLVKNDLHGHGAVVYLSKINAHELVRFRDNGILGPFKKYVHTLNAIEGALDEFLERYGCEIPMKNVIERKYVAIVKSQINKSESVLYKKLRQSIKPDLPSNFKYFFD